MGDSEKIRSITERLTDLHSGQLEFIETILIQLTRPATFTRNPKSDFITPCVLQDFGDTLRIHHCFSAEAFTKDRFEYAIERAFNNCGVTAHRAPRGNPGHDLDIEGVPFSLKTQADKSIKVGTIHVSKFMELGKGQWSDNSKDLEGLRDQFFHHMRSYQRIITLRRLQELGFEIYELVEIPKALLTEAKNGEFEMMLGSSQMPKPGYCTVKDKEGHVKFQLYFDGGTERKLQIKALDKSLCIVHATWKFPVSEQVAL